MPGIYKKPIQSRCYKCNHLYTHGVGDLGMCPTCKDMYFVLKYGATEEELLKREAKLLLPLPLVSTEVS